VLLHYVVKMSYTALSIRQTGSQWRRASQHMSNCRST